MEQTEGTPARNGDTSSPRAARSSMTSSGFLAVNPRRRDSDQEISSESAGGQSQLKTSPSLPGSTRPFPNTTSPLKASALQARFGRIETREAELEQNLEEALRERRNREAGILRLQEDRSAGMGIRDQRHSDVEAARKAFEEAAAYHQTREDLLADAENDVDRSDCQLQQALTQLENVKMGIAEIEQERRELQRAKEHVSRQANRLKLVREDIDAIVNQAQSSRPFLANLFSVVDGTSTEEAMKDVKAKLFDAFMGVDEHEVKRLAETILLEGQEDDVAGPSSREVEEAPEEENTVRADQHAAIGQPPSSRDTTSAEGDVSADQSRIITFNYNPDDRAEHRRRRGSPLAGHRDRRPRLDDTMPRESSRASSRQRRQRS
ncbi:hypothetical protein H2204_008358 [Knufia peltigerae]|uniref:Uncharacterized protein n=1 Tax=Knufia peltigerae TaxID=1002370 RepID=A0AA38Y078_9EURO|nr:hypothetical protein H2204_008358 [Knufia peltigerae]